MSSLETTTYVHDIFIKMFRNINETRLSFGRGHNLLVGPNGHGKTNCLEAIALACSLRPMQSLKNLDLIKLDEPAATIVASFTDHRRIEIEILPAGKRARLNDHAVRAAQTLAKSIALVSFIPAELSMIAGPSALRRRALDQACASLFFEHVAAFKAYEKVLFHRNRLLKDWPVDHATLKTFTELLIKEGAQVIAFRLKTIEALHERFSRHVRHILGLNQTGTLSYVMREQEIKNHTPCDLMAMLDQEHQMAREQEIRRKVTLFGPHLDDLNFYINGINAKRAASRGQSRALVLAFKLAQMLSILAIRGCAPIIILDDIVSELDHDVRFNLIETIKSLKTQAFFSATDVEAFASLDADQIFSIHHGSVV